MSSVRGDRRDRARRCRRRHHQADRATVIRVHELPVKIEESPVEALNY